MYSYPFFNNQQQILPQQQIIQVNGKASVDSIQLAPNSSILVLDTTAPIVWMCVSDGVGRVTSTPYDISVHKEEPPVDVKSIEQRLAILNEIVIENFFLYHLLAIESTYSLFKALLLITLAVPGTHVFIFDGITVFLRT